MILMPVRRRESALDHGDRDTENEGRNEESRRRRDRGTNQILLGFLYSLVVHHVHSIREFLGQYTVIEKESPNLTNPRGYGDLELMILTST